MKLIALLVIMCFSIIFFNGNDDYEWLDPDTEAEESTKPQGMNNIQEGKKTLILPGFGPGDFEHPDLLEFCDDIISTTKSISDKDQSVIRVLLTGYADGLVNKTFISSDDLPEECSKYSEFRNGQQDIQLATIRACLVEAMLKELSTDNSFFTYVDLTKTIIDVPDGGDTGSVYRKVEATIEYLNNK